MEVKETLPPWQYIYSVLNHFLYDLHVEETQGTLFISPSYFSYKNAPNLNLPPPQSTICSYAPDSILRILLLEFIIT